ncbi:chloroplast ferredoxin [Aspergillus oleicola]
MTEHKITFTYPHNAGHTLSFDCAEDTTLLKAAERVGIKWDFSSRSGVSHEEAARLIEGEVIQPGQSCLKWEHIEEGFILTDVAYPRSDCVLVVNLGSEVL